MTVDTILTAVIVAIAMAYVAFVARKKARVLLAPRSTGPGCSGCSGCGPAKTNSKKPADCLVSIGSKKR